MINGKKFKSGKAYKDSKLCNVLTIARSYTAATTTKPVLPSAPFTPVV